MPGICEICRGSNQTAQINSTCSCCCSVQRQLKPRPAQDVYFSLSPSPSQSALRFPVIKTKFPPDNEHECSLLIFPPRQFVVHNSVGCSSTQNRYFYESVSLHKVLISEKLSTHSESEAFSQSYSKEMLDHPAQKIT